LILKPKCRKNPTRQMNAKDLFLGIQQFKSNPPIQLHIDNNEREYNANNKILKYVTNYYKQLFTTEGESEECLQAHTRCCEATLKLVTPQINSQLTMEITAMEIHQALKSLPTNKALSKDGLPTKFYIALWELVGNHILEVLLKRNFLQDIPRPLNHHIA